MNYLRYFHKKRILIPGGNGFVGSHIVDQLKKNNCEVLVPATRDGIDFRKREDCFSYLSLSRPDIVINCAAIQGGIGYHSGKQADLLLDNLSMGLNLMLASQNVGVKKFVNVVAGCSYPGYLAKGEMNEEDYWDGKLHDSIFSYGWARKTSVVYGSALKKQYGFNSIHLVMANMYGPREHFRPDQSKALAGLIKKIYDAKKNRSSTVEIWGTGKPIRDWLYVKDGAEGILRAASVYDDIEQLNIATGVGISVKKLAETIKKVIGFRGTFVYDTRRPDGALHKTFGVGKMRKILGWVPKTTIEKGIKETVRWFDKHYDWAIKH